MPITKRGKRYLAEIRTRKIRDSEGKPFYTSKYFDTRLEAQRWEVEMKAQLSGGDNIVGGYTLRDAMQRYAKEVSPSRKGARWEEIRLQKLERDSIADIQLTSLRRTDLESWIARQTISPASINRELNQLSAVFRECRKRWGWMSHNPMEELDRPKNPRPRDRLISDKERMVILEALGYDEAKPAVETSYQQIAVAFLLALETAMRQGELWSLTWEHVYLERCFVHLPDTKNGYHRDVPLSSRAIALFNRLSPRPKGRVFTMPQASAGTIFRRVVKLAGIEGLTFHDTRHTAITQLARKLEMLELARMVGHRDPRSLMIYYNETASELAKRLG